MLMTFFFVGCALAVPELILVFNCAPLRRLIERNPIIEMVFSLALSAVMAWAMGLGVGVTLAVGNIFSTAITLAVYHWNLQEKWKGLNMFFKRQRQRVDATMQELRDVIHFVHTLIFAPWNGFMSCVRWYNSHFGRSDA